ncbi:MAG: DUF2125 domain-containing protein [Pseudomonadota bacterium]
MKWLAVAVAAGIGLWTGGWFYVASISADQIDKVIQSAARFGVTITCENRSIRGFPFRMGLFCDQTGVEAQEQAFVTKAGALRTVALLYKPGNIIAELDGPAEASPVPDAKPIKLDWDSLRASVRLGLSVPQQISLVGLNLEVAIPVLLASSDAAAEPLAAMLKLKSNQGAVHLRPTPESEDRDLDLAFQVRDFKNALASVFPEAGFDVDVDLHLTDGMARAVSGAFDQQIMQFGQDGEIRKVRIASHADPTSQIELSGPFRIDTDGLVTGKMDLSVSNPAGLLDYVSSVDEQAAASVKQIVNAVTAFGQPGKLNGTPSRTVKIDIDKGKMRAGFIPLGEIPPLFGT